MIKKTEATAFNKMALTRPHLIFS